MRGLSTESVAVQPGCHIGFRPADQIVVFVFIITVLLLSFRGTGAGKTERLYFKNWVNSGKFVTNACTL